MYRLSLYGLLIVLATMLQCERPPFERLQRLLPFRASQAEQPFAVPDYDSLFSRLIELKAALVAAPADTFLIRLMVAAAVDASESNFYSVGWAAPDSAMADSLRLALQKQAALRDGESSALYLKAWHKGSVLPYGKRIFGKILYRKVLLERQQHDTIYQLIKVPATSIVLE